MQLYCYFRRKIENTFIVYRTETIRKYSPSTPNNVTCLAEEGKHRDGNCFNIQRICFCLIR